MRSWEQSPGKAEYICGNNLFKEADPYRLTAAVLEHKAALLSTISQRNETGIFQLPQGICILIPN